MQKYKSNITTTSGAAVRGVPVFVLKEDGSNAALFLDRAGTSPAPNPLTTGPDGVFYFYAVNGRYSIRTTVEGVTITDADVVLLMDPEEITVAGPIAEAVAAAQAAAIAAEFAVEASGIPDLISAAQNAVVDANNAVSLSATSANNAAISKTGADSARDAAAQSSAAAAASASQIGAAVLSFPDYATASAAAATLPNGQVVTFKGAENYYYVSGGLLFADEARAKAIIDYSQTYPESYVNGAIKKKFVDVTCAPFFATTSAPASDAINAALAYAGASGGDVFIPPGEWKIDKELKVPSRVRLVGDGIDRTILTAVATLPINQNVITNSNNDRILKDLPNTDIQILDMTVNGNWQERDPTATGSTGNQGCCVKLANVHRFLVQRVRAIFGVLHCIDVSASNYFDDGTNVNQPPGLSMYGAILDCVAESAHRDDAITTHNSGYISIERCYSFYDRAAFGEPSTNQHGIEVDEGSFYVSVRDCTVRGTCSGVQIKSHSTTRPANNVLIDGVRIFDTNYALHLETVAPALSVPYSVAVGVVIKNIWIDGVTKNSGLSSAYILRLTGYSGTSLENINVSNFGNATFNFDSCGDLHIAKVNFLTASTRSGDSIGLFHGFGGFTNGMKLTLEDVYSTVPQPIPVVRISSLTGILSAKNLKVLGSDSSLSAVWKNITRNDVIEDVSSNGWAGVLFYDSYAANYGNGFELRKGLKMTMFLDSGSPEGIVSARNGTILTTIETGRIFRKGSGSGNTGWIEVT